MNLLSLTLLVVSIKKYMCIMLSFVLCFDGVCRASKLVGLLEHKGMATVGSFASQLGFGRH